MPALSSTLRNQLERTVVAARDRAEEGAWAALERLAVNKAEPLSHMTAEQRDLRVKLRAKGRQLGDVREKNGEQDIYYLHRECAYEYWHQMLFARFLAENNLLIHPDMQVPVTLEECEELAAGRGLHGRRQPGLGLPVLADEAKEGGQRLGREDRRQRTARRHAALHRRLHGEVPAAQHAGRLVGREEINHRGRGERRE